MQISSQPYPFDSTAPAVTTQTTTSVAGSATSVTLKASLQADPDLVETPIQARIRAKHEASQLKMQNIIPVAPEA